MANFLFGCLGFGADATALSAISFIGGPGDTLGEALGKLVSQTSILRNAVLCSIAAALDVSMIEVARVI
ncbi:MAG: hypothetical protein LBF24_01800 [Puniceicoccales bacterium]|nr:hypothetical protein [Puniceicoccales bacterium]